MKFVYFGYDFLLQGAQRLMDDGHELVGIFTFPCDNIFNFNRETLTLGRRLAVPVIAEKPQTVHIENFLKKGCDCFLAAGYIYKIPPVDPQKAYAINLHPSLLPKVRGLMPTPHIILNHPKASGITVHKLAPEFDKGDILYQEELPLHERETVETLSARIAMRGPEILSKVMTDLPGYWENAKKQDERQASHFPPPDDTMRTLNWNLPVKKLDTIGRAFGRYGSLARFDNTLWVVYDMDVWPEKHNFKPGEIARRLNKNIVIAAKDGFACLKEFQKVQ